MEILEVRPQGYCGGVSQAIDKVLKLREENPDEKITLLGSLVHNDFVRKALEEKNIVTLEAKGKTREELLDEIDDGVVVFTAHGVSRQVMDKAKRKNLKILNAACPFVMSTQKIVAEKIRDGYCVLYAGKKGHPESEAITSSDPSIVLLEKEEDIPDGITKPVFVTNQTTLNILDLQDLYAAIQRKYPHAVIKDEICSATRIRQQAVLQLHDQNIDVLLVVGDPKSNNTRQLRAAGKKAGIQRVYQLESKEQLTAEMVENCNRLAITSGASTPSFLVKEIIQTLQPQTCFQEIEKSIL